MRRIGGWGACCCVVVAVAMALTACGSDGSSLATGDPLHDLITLDQLVAPDFTVSSPAAHVDASTLAGGDASLAAAITAAGLQSAASVEYQRGIDFSTSNGPLDVVATVDAIRQYRRRHKRLRRERQAARRHCPARCRRPPDHSATKAIRSAWCARHRAACRRWRSPWCGASATLSTSSSRAVATAARASMTSSSSPVCRPKNESSTTGQLLRGSQRKRSTAQDHRPGAPRGHDQQVCAVETSAGLVSGIERGEHPVDEVTHRKPLGDLREDR